MTDEQRDLIDLKRLPGPLRWLILLTGGPAAAKKPTRDAWMVAMRRFLDGNAWLRRGIVILTTVAVPAGLALLQFGETIGVRKDAAVTAITVLTTFGVLLGILFALTERSSGEIAEALGQAELELLTARNRARSMREQRERMKEQHAAELTRLGGLEALRQRLSFLVGVALVIEHKLRGAMVPSSTIFMLQNELAEVGPQVFGWTAAEKWTLATYLWDEGTGELTCVASVRPTSSDYGEGHRSWRSGHGMVGMTYMTEKQLVVSDAHTSELESVMRDPDEGRAARDRDQYRSVAAVPIYTPEAYSLAPGDETQDGNDNGRRLFGVVVATSDVPERFNRRKEGELPLTAMTALAEAIAMVLIASDLRRVFTDPPNNGGVNGHEVPEEADDGSEAPAG